MAPALALALALAEADAVEDGKPNPGGGWCVCRGCVDRVC